MLKIKKKLQSNNSLFLTTESAPGLSCSFADQRELIFLQELFVFL